MGFGLEWIVGFIRKIKIEEYVMSYGRGIISNWKIIIMYFLYYDR